MYGSYRFPSKKILQYISKKYDKLQKMTNNKDVDSGVIKRRLRKMELMIAFLNQLDLDELYKSYLKIFTKYSPDVGNTITTCTRPSFINIYDHLTPYYTRKELIRLAQNMEITIKGDLYDPDNIDEICQKVMENDINGDILLEHQKFIVENNKVGLIKYYTIQGSYFMNQYMRGLTPYYQKNSFFEKLIKEIWNLIKKAPEFDNDYYLYRFIDDDSFLKGLKEGDIYQDAGFMSTTRDPFYRDDAYKFGFILMKIKIPGGVKGVGLSLETLSQFPKEQEIILAPYCKLKLINKNANCKYYHIDQDYGSKVMIRYEFEWIENSPVEFHREDMISNESEDDPKEQESKLVDFLKLDETKTMSLQEKVRIFSSNNLNEMNMFNVKIGEQQFQLLGEWYNSTGAYKDFYSIETQDGFSIYTILDNHILFMIELGERGDTRMMHVNYYLRYTNVDRNKIIPEEDFVKFISSVANYFQINNIIIYSDFITCDEFKSIDKHAKKIDTHEKIQRHFSSTPYDSVNKDKEVSKDTQLTTYYGGYHSLDIYNYLLDSKERFKGMGLNKMELTPMFSYQDLDILRKTDPLKILNKEDSDEIYQIYLRNYYVSHQNKNNIADFYLWMVKHYCYLISTLIKKMGRLYKINNPFERITYRLNSDMYLYNRGIISFLNDESTESFKIKNVYNMQINEYRESTDKMKKLSLF
jgi:hypothetical protein